RVFIFVFLLSCFVGFATAQDTNFATGPQYLMTSGSPLLAQPISTPTLSLGEQPPALPFNEQTAAPTSPENASDIATVSNTLELDRPTALFSIYYGMPRVSIVEITGEEAAPVVMASLPSSIAEQGVVEATDAQVLRLRGVGVPLSEVSAYWK